MSIYFQNTRVNAFFFFFFSQNANLFHLCFLAGIYGGFLLGVRSVNGLAFYDWENTELVRRIEIQPKHVSYEREMKIFPCLCHVCVY